MKFRKIIKNWLQYDRISSQLNSAPAMLNSNPWLYFNIAPNIKVSIYALDKVIFSTSNSDPIQFYILVVRAMSLLASPYSLYQIVAHLNLSKEADPDKYSILY